jgi:hypothetical protein
LVPVFVLALGAFLSTATSGRTVGALVRVAAVATVAAIHLIEISHAVSVVEGPSSQVALCQVPSGGRLEVLGYSPDRRWVKVRTSLNVVGWVPAHELPPRALP